MRNSLENDSFIINRCVLARHGAVSLELVMVAAVLVPLSFTLFFLAVRVAPIVYKTITTLLEWPYP